MKRTKRVSALICAVVLFLLQCLMLGVTAADVPSGASFSITAETNRLHKKKTLQLWADTNAHLTWTSSDPAVATVDENGLVTGISIGHATIQAADERTGEQADFTVYVVRRNAPWRVILENTPILGYRYSFENDYYYTDDRNCWQKKYGFNYVFDLVAPLFLLEYDYTRAFFNYDGMDWMIQLWKGQYGLVFFGSEVGVYNRPESDDEETWLAHYDSPQEQDYLTIGTALYHKYYGTDEYVQEFETPYERHWWATGFVPGHLADLTPCSELRLETRITLKDEVMAEKFADALLECKFQSVPSMDDLEPDTFYRDGADVYVQWQYLSEAANSHVVQTSFYGLAGLSGTIMALQMIGEILIFIVFGILFWFLFI